MTIAPDAGTLTWGSPQGQGLHFNGRGDVATVPVPRSTRPTVLSVALSVKFDKLPSGEGMYLLRLLDANSRKLQLVATSDNRFHFRIAGSTFGSTSPMIQAGVWYHLVLTYDPVIGTFRLFVNGDKSIDSSGWVSGSNWPSGMSSLMLGNDDSVGGTLVYFAGEMDEVRAYNRVLSEPEALGEYRRPVREPARAGRLVGLQRTGRRPVARLIRNGTAATQRGAGLPYVYPQRWPIRMGIMSGTLLRLRRPV